MAQGREEVAPQGTVGLGTPWVYKPTVLGLYGKPRL